MDYIKNTQNWIENFVIGLNLCPFAKKPFDENLIGYKIYDGEDIEALHQWVVLQLVSMEKKSAQELETMLLIIPNFLSDFHDFWDYVSFLNERIAESDFNGKYQIASFHPNYYFEGSKDSDASNYTNRSPYPMLHLLRESSVEWAVNHHPNTAEIPNRNMERLNQMGHDEIEKLLRK